MVLAFATTTPVEVPQCAIAHLTLDALRHPGMTVEPRPFVERPSAYAACKKLPRKWFQIGRAHV